MMRVVDEKRENEFDSRKKRKLLAGECLSLIGGDDELVALKEQIDWLELAQNEVREIRGRACEKLKRIEAREQSLMLDRELLASKEKKVDLVIESLDERIRVVDKRESEFNLFLDGKMMEVVLKEDALRLKGEELAKAVKLVEDKFRGREELRESLDFAEYKLETVKVAIDRFKKIEFRENVAWESMDKQLEEFEKMKKELNLFREDKIREFELKEPSEMTERLAEGEKRGLELLKRLELAQGNVEGLKKMVDDRVKENSRKEIEVNSIRDWVVVKMDEVDSKAKELEEREKIIKVREDNVARKEYELRRKKRKLEDEIERKEKRLARENRRKKQELEDENEWKEKKLARENQRKRQELENELERKRKELELLEYKLHMKKIETDLKEKNLEACQKQLEIKQKEVDSAEDLEIKELELGQQGWTIAHLKIDHNSPDLKFVVRMDGKTLQTFLNDPVKDLDSMLGEICIVLRLSSDPAKLVLDAMEGFYPPHLREEDMASDVRRTCVVLLEQLSKMSPKIKPCVRDEALKLASEWRSKMNATAENSLEVLGFLHLVAAFDLGTSFDNDEILRLLTNVDQHRQTCELCRVLGFVERATDNIQLEVGVPSSTADVQEQGSEGFSPTPRISFC